MKSIQHSSLLCLCLLVISVLIPMTQTAALANSWSFTVAGDMRRYIYYDDIHGWDHACRAMATEGAGEFLVSPGDLDQQYSSNPGDFAFQIVDQEIASGFPFFPGVGNHEFDDLNTMNAIRNFNHGGIYYDVNPGPPGSENTTYSWDHGDAHFVMLNECFDGSYDLGAANGNWNPVLDAWFIADLEANARPIIFVFGHFPAFPQPDRDTGLSMHTDDTDFNMANNGAYRDALWNILVDHNVTAYVCGHSHVSSAVNIEGVWQVDFGHARGPRDQTWHGPSTFLRFNVGDDFSVNLETWRQPYTSGAGNEAPYTLWHTDLIKPGDLASAVNQLRPDKAPTAFPNPFNPQTTISWVQDHQGPVSVTVYDLSGKFVATLIKSDLPAGWQSIDWNGRNNNGLKMAAGVYLVEVQQNNQQNISSNKDTIKIVLVP